MTRILIVDDFSALRQNVAEILECEGFQVSQADSPVTGFAEMEQSCPDMIVSDLSFPGHYGTDFFDRVRHSSAFAKLPILAISGFGDAEHIQQATLAGANDYLVKPFSAGDLVQHIQDLLIA
jgi:DNA-binding response OmpR family regulator